MGNRIASRQLKFTLGNFFLFFVFFFGSARFAILEDKNLIKMNYQAESGAVWLLLFALAIIRAANAVEETVVVENWNEADDLCAHAKAGQHFVIRCKHRCECREGTVCVPYCPPSHPPPGKSNCKLVKEENECCGQWKCNEGPSSELAEKLDGLEGGTY